MSNRELDRRPGKKDEDLDDDEARRITESYVRMCLTSIEFFTRSADELREWYRDERDLRFEKYGLTKSQIDRIVLACRDQVERLKKRAQKIA